MQIDPEELEARTDVAIGALDAVADLVLWLQPGISIEGEKLAPLLGLLAAEIRAVHRASCRALHARQANDQ